MQTFALRIRHRLLRRHLQLSLAALVSFTSVLGCRGKAPKADKNTGPDSQGESTSPGKDQEDKDKADKDQSPGTDKNKKEGKDQDPDKDTSTQDKKNSEDKGETKETGTPKDSSKSSESATSSSTPSDDSTEPSRIVAVGDLHGDIKATRAALQLAGIIDNKDKWVGGRTIFVQTGDVLDRGDDEPEIMDLLDSLVPQAQKAGGRVVLLLGNHELMNALGDLRYVTADGFRDYANTKLPDKIDPKVASKPRSWQHRWAAFAPGYAGGKRLAKRSVVAKVGDSVFLHAGLTPKYAKLGIDSINQQAQAWLRDGGPAPSWVNDSSGPVWSRHYSMNPDSMDCSSLRSALATLKAKRMVVGHTVHIEGIGSECNGLVWTIDVGMSRHYGGQPAALEIVDNKVKVLRFDPREFKRLRRQAK